MKWIKKILFPLFSLFLLWQSAEIMRQVLAAAPSSFTIREKLVVAVLLALYVTGIFAFSGFAYPTLQLLPARYYRIQNPRQLSRFCRLLGLQYFKVFLLVFFWGWKKNRRKYFDGTRSGLTNLVYQSKQSEFGHVCAFATLVVLGIILLVTGHLQLATLLAPLNILGNLYPVLLQRQHRMRIATISNQ